MGKSFLADFPGNFFSAPLGSHASVASNGANALLVDCAFVAPANLKLLSAWRQVQADEATVGTATTTATYRRVTILNGGSAGTGTTIMASSNGNGASVASLGTRSFATTANNTASQGEILIASQLTVGGTNADATVLQAGKVWIAYELL